jgi:ubiquinone/menaquinone biosynthesis C-methylase UbiE
MIPIEVTRDAWKRAGTFPASKETIYSEHATIQEFIQHVGEKVLEYGCGGGSDTLSYLRRKCRVWYADVVPENIEATRARIAIVGLQAFAHPVPMETSWPIPIAGQVMDCVSSHGVLHHIEEPEPVVAEFHRVLRMGGVCYVMLYTETLWAEHARQVKSLLAAGKCQSETEAFGWCTDGVGVPYARAYTEAEGRALLEGAKLRVVSATAYHKGLFRTFKAVKT